MAWAEREWSDIRPGDYVLNGGAPWLVSERNALGEVTVRSSHGDIVNIGKQSGRIWAWDAAMEAGVAVIANHLGGTVIGDTTRRKS